MLVTDTKSGAMLRAHDAETTGYWKRHPDRFLEILPVRFPPTTETPASPTSVQPIKRKPKSAEGV